MAIAFRSKGAWCAGTTSVSFTMPTTHVAGDLLLMFIHTPNNAITTAPGNGWALLSPSPVSTGTANTALGVRLTVYWKIAASSSEAAQTVAVTSGTATNGLTVAYSGVNTTTPFDLTPVSAIAAASTANISCPTLTTVTDGAMIVNAIALDNDSNSSTLVTSPVNASLVSPTLRHGQTVSTSTGGGIAFIDGIKTSAGLISATTATVAAAARAYLTIALRPIVVDARTGSCSISNTSTVTATIQKGGKSSSSIAQASTVTVTVKSEKKTAISVSQASTVVAQVIKKALGIASISQPYTVTMAGHKVVEEHSGSASIFQPSTVTISVKKNGKGLAAISQSSTVTDSGKKKAAGSVSISQPSTITDTGKKAAKAIASISNTNTVVSSGKKQANGAAQISQSSAVTTFGKKLAKASAQISNAASVIVTGAKGTLAESKFGQFLINQASTVTIAGIKKTVGISTIYQGSILSSNGRKGARSTVSITRNTGISTAGRKSAFGSLNITSGVSVVTNSVKRAFGIIEISVAELLNVVGVRLTAEKLSVANKKTIKMIQNIKSVLIGADRKTVSLTPPDVETITIISNKKEVCPWK